MSWWEATIAILPNFLVAIVVLVFFALLGKIAKKTCRKLLYKVSANKAVNNLMQTLIYISVLMTGIFISLGILNLEKTVTSLLAGAGVIGLALGFAFQEIASNFFSGILIAFKKPYKIGDIVEAKDYRGTVKAIDLRTTSIQTFDGIEVIMPNKYMFTEPISNFTSTSDRRVDLDVGVSYADDLRLVRDIALKALEDVEGRVDSKEIEFFYKEFGNSSINFQVRVWVDYPGNMNFLKSKHDAIMKLKEAFDENEITIPFPIRTLDFDIKGGENLSVPLGKLFSEKKSSPPNTNPESNVAHA